MPKNYNYSLIDINSTRIACLFHIHAPSDTIAYLQSVTENSCAGNFSGATQTETVRKNRFTNLINTQWRFLLNLKININFSRVIADICPSVHPRIHLSTYLSEHGHDNISCQFKIVRMSPRAAKEKRIWTRDNNSRISSHVTSFTRHSRFGTIIS